MSENKPSNKAVELVRYIVDTHWRPGGIVAGARAIDDHAAEAIAAAVSAERARIVAALEQLAAQYDDDKLAGRIDFTQWHNRKTALTDAGFVVKGGEP